MLKLITFDFWNTLYKGPPDAAISDQRARDVQKVFRNEGLEFSLPTLQDSFRSAWREAYSYQRVCGRDYGPQGQIEHVLNKLGIDKISHTDDLYEAYTTTLLIQPPDINDGVRKTLSSLRGRFTLAVICNSGATPGVHLRYIMKKDQLLDSFSFLVFSDEVGFAKPNPAIFHYVLNKLGCVSGAAMHVGDDAITDVIGAKKAGLQAVWLAPKAKWPLPEADHCIESLPELISLL